MLANETLVDVLSYVNRGTLDTVQMMSKSFRDIVDAKLANVCLRRIHTARFQRDARSYTVVVTYGVHGCNEMKIEGISREVEAVRDMLQLCRAATIGMMKLFDAHMGTFDSIRTATLEAFIDYAQTFVVRALSFGLTVLASDASLGLFMRALESANGVKLMCPPHLTSEEEKSVKQYCGRMGIEFTLSMF
ncbi:hypothetical protein AAVH_13032 [Aphelenchoides avenae]|nr:hypothetical protein AAVH_13032 [Aphelenchus avenae]